MPQVTLEVPIALKQLIKRNNQLLQNYQQELLDEISEANVQMMQILQLNPVAGWKLDVDNMIYVRAESNAVITDPDGHLVENNASVVG